MDINQFKVIRVRCGLFQPVPTQIPKQMQIIFSREDCIILTELDSLWAAGAIVPEPQIDTIFTFDDLIDKVHVPGAGVHSKVSFAVLQFHFTVNSVLTVLVSVFGLV